MSEFRFAAVNWLHAVWFVLALVGILIVLELRGRSILDRMLSPMMQGRLIYRISLPRRMAAIGLIGAALVALVFAMMRPQWGMTVQAMSRIDSQIMICLDVSKSMLAEDAVPNRLDRSKAEIESMLALMNDGQQVGLTAFAGKASVLCPMTTDFGFLRLVLAEARPESIGMGGTKIGDALRKAIDGFREAGDINRLILLITDGEDHDSFPLDAAKVARERGIHIVCIGFGDEAGSNIEITNPDTGARTFIKDRNGQNVVSRLDGETLRDIALETDGAYIPAGTGALDLESIYRAHIATLLTGRDQAESRVIRSEAYQWCVLVALVLLIVALLTTSAFSLKAKAAVDQAGRLASAPSTAVLVLGAACLWAAPAKALAQLETGGQASPATDEPAVSPDAVDVPAVGGGAVTNEPPGDELTPREVYNQAVAFVSRDPDRAEPMLRRARQEAGSDGELRFRALYNLGWVEVGRADAALEQKPAEALEHLQQAANRFREAIRVRPDSMDARHNLEVVSRRILELADSLAKRNPKDLATRLDELIARQRSHLAELQSLVDRVDPEEQDIDRIRSDFRGLGVTQRQIIADMQKFADDARQELDSIHSKADQEQAADQRLRAAQLSAMQRYIEDSLQRMHKSRSLTRRMQGSRSFVRWAGALTAAKRGRDQLRNPIEVLGVIIGDAMEAAQFTRLMALANAPQLGDQPVNAPGWLSKDFLQELQLATTERTAELVTNLSAGVRQQNNPPEGEDANTDPETERFLANVRRAMPWLEKAEERFRDAGTRVDDDDFETAFASQSEAIAALGEAAEFFYDLRRLIEVIYRDEQSVVALLGQMDAQPQQAQALAGAASELQQKNVSRSQRLDSMLELELQRLQQQAGSEPAQPPPQGASAGAQDQAESEQERFRIARQILQQVLSGMTQIDDQLTEIAAGSLQTSPDAPPTPTPVSETEAASTEKTDPQAEEASTADSDGAPPDDGPSVAGPAMDSSVLAALQTQAELTIQEIEELRRLFFSLVEHLRETTQRQAELGDQTNEVFADASEATGEQVGPLESRQRQLQQISEQLAAALAEQATQAANPGQSQPTNPGQNAQADDASQALDEASKLVDQAQASMALAAEELALGDDDTEAPIAELDFDQISQNQSAALQKLSEALSLLDDSERQQDQPNEQNQQSQQQQDQSGENQDQEEARRDQQRNLSAEQLLQLIRDREAERRRERPPLGVGAGSQVEKDW